MSNRLLVAKTNSIRPRRGSTLVEFALVSSILMLMMVGIVQYGLAYFLVGTLNHAATEGARYGSIHPQDQAAITARVKSIVGGVNKTDMTVQSTFPDNSTKPGNRITVTISYPMVSFMPGLNSRTIVRSSTSRIEKEDDNP